MISINLRPNLAANGESVVVLVPAAEGGAVNLNDCALDEGLGADELVVGGVVQHYLLAKSIAVT